MHTVKILKWFDFFTDFKFYAPIAILYFTQVSGSFALGMSIFSITMVSSAVFEIPTGIFSDIVGRRKTMILGAFSAVLYAIFFAIGQSYWILVVGALFEGLSKSWYSGTENALLHETLAEKGDEEKFDEYLGKISAMGQTALAISAVLGSLIATWSFPLIMWLSVVSQIICLVLAFQLKEPKNHSRKSGNIYSHLKEAVQNFTRNKKLRLLSISDILSEGFGEASYLFQAAFYNTVWPVWAIGIAKTFSNIGASFSFHYSGKIIRRIGALELLVSSQVYNRIINSIAVLFPSVGSPILMSSSSLFYGATSVAKSTLMQKEFSNEQRATMGSLNSFAGSLFFGIVAVLLGYIADLVSPGQALLGIQVLSLSVLAIYLILFKNHKK